MATPADERLLELLNKWLKSLELHIRYSSLDDDRYAKVREWPPHQRPSRWILDLAKQKALTLHRQIEERVARGDGSFSDSLELMIFLANLLGAEHIERFIPLAAGAAQPTEPSPAASPQGASSTGTREMPAFLAAGQRLKSAPIGTAEVARTERKESRARGTPAAEQHVPTKSAVHDQVIADAVRLVQWGRKWYELAELISKMADRPSLIDVRRILKDNKQLIDQKAGRG